MKVIVLAAALVVATPAFAGSFDGTWKVDPSTFQASTKPYTRVLANGHYHCTCSNPPEDFPADGRFHPTAGHTSYDEAQATVIDAKSVKFAYKLKGKPIAEVVTTLSNDNKTATDKWTDTSSPHVVTGTDEEIRVGPAPAGAHAISGVWRDSDKTTISDSGATTVISQTGDMLTVSNADGTKFTAKIGGPFVSVSGSATSSMVSVAQAGPHTLTVVFKRGDKVMDHDTWDFSTDGHSAHIVSTNVPSDRTVSMTAYKQ